MEYSKNNVKARNPYLTPVNTLLVILNVGLFLASDIVYRVTGSDLLVAMGAMFPPAVLCGQWYRLITGAFLHSDLGHLFNNMLLLVCLGSYLERVLGKIKYLIFYFVMAVCSSLTSLVWMLGQEELTWSIGASGVVFAIIGALLWVLLRNRTLLKQQRGLLTRFVIMIVLSLYYGFTSVGVDNAAHVGGLLFGFVFGVLLYRKREW